MGTTAFEVKRQLIAKTIANPAFSELAADFAVWDSSYSSTDRPHKLIWFGEIQWQNETPASLGGFKREETYDVRFGIEIHESDETQAAANAKAEVLLIALELMMRDPRALGIGNLNSIGIVPIGLGEGPDGTEGRATLFAGQVHVVARK